jgi:hypothetical protein
MLSILGREGNWIFGEDLVDRDIKFYIKEFEEPSEFGINNGKISKLEIRLGNKIVANYERGWSVRPWYIVKKTYEEILKIFN